MCGLDGLARGLKSLDTGRATGYCEGVNGNCLVICDLSNAAGRGTKFMGCTNNISATPSTCGACAGNSASRAVCTSATGGAAVKDLSPERAYRYLNGVSGVCLIYCGIGNASGCGYKFTICGNNYWSVIAGGGKKLYVFFVRDPLLGYFWLGLLWRVWLGFTRCL